MRRLLITSAFVLLTLSACATIAPGPAVTVPVSYGCKAGKGFTATYPASGDRVLVVAGGLSKTLPLARSAYGIHTSTSETP